MGGITVTYNGSDILKLGEGQTGSVSINGTNASVDVRQHLVDGPAAYTVTDDAGFKRQSHIGLGRKLELSDFLSGLWIHHGKE